MDDRIAALQADIKAGMQELREEGERLHEQLRRLQPAGLSTTDRLVIAKAATILAAMAGMMTSRAGRAEAAALSQHLMRLVGEHAPGAAA